jgi:hypothetical protein
VKKIVSLSVACFIISGLFFISCKKNDIKDLEYKGTYKKKYVEAYVYNKDGAMVLWFQVLDQIDDKSSIAYYKKAIDKVDKYPAKIYKDRSIWLLVNNRIEIRVTADDTAKNFQDTDELKKFIKLFDLAGMENVTGPKLKAEELEKFIPKLGGK